MKIEWPLQIGRHIELDRIQDVDTFWHWVFCYNEILDKDFGSKFKFFVILGFRYSWFDETKEQEHRRLKYAVDHYGEFLKAVRNYKDETLR